MLLLSLQPTLVKDIRENVSQDSVILASASKSLRLTAALHLSLQSLFSKFLFAKNVSTTALVLSSILMLTVQLDPKIVKLE